MSKEMAQEILQMTFRELIALLVDQMDEEGSDEIKMDMDLSPHNFHFKVNLTVRDVTPIAELKGESDE
jgi:hypothetical protein